MHFVSKNIKIQTIKMPLSAFARVRVRETVEQIKLMEMNENDTIFSRTSFDVFIRVHQSDARAHTHAHTHSMEKFVTRYIVGTALVWRTFHLLFRTFWRSSAFFMDCNESSFVLSFSLCPQCVGCVLNATMCFLNEKLIFLLWKLLFYSLSERHM